MEDLASRPITSIPTLIKIAIHNKDKDKIKEIYNSLILQGIISPLIVDEENRLIDWKQNDNNYHIMRYIVLAKHNYLL